MYVVAKVKLYQGSKDETGKLVPPEPNKNGVMPLYLEVLNGKYPNRTVMDGTIAKGEGIEVGKTYLFSWKEIEPDPVYGRKFVFTMVKELTMVECIQSEMVGKPEVFKVESKVNEDSNVKDKRLSLTE